MAAPGWVRAGEWLEGRFDQLGASVILGPELSDYAEAAFRLEHPVEGRVGLAAKDVDFLRRDQKVCEAAPVLLRLSVLRLAERPQAGSPVGQ
jgi:hypothetical protein